MSNKIPEGWKASSSSASAGIDFECFFDVAVAELEVVEEDSGKLLFNTVRCDSWTRGRLSFSSVSIVDKFWGIRFWEGFANPVMPAYCQKWHLDIGDSRPGMFTVPVPFFRCIFREQE